MTEEQHLLYQKMNCLRLEVDESIVSDILKSVDAVIQEMPSQITGETSDGYHTFNELYEFRKVFNAALFNQWAALGKYNVHKSYRHNDGELAFGGGWFIVVAKLPSGQISNHYEEKEDVLERILAIIKF